MELIPILSFIILVATISTFILAVGAYILYKLRERKGRTYDAPAPRYIEAELFTPNMPSILQAAPTLQAAQAQFQQDLRPNADVRPTQQQTMQQAQAQGRMGAQQQANSRQQDFQQPSGSNEEFEDNPATKKFMKYTTEGYVPVTNKTKTGENLKWR